MEFTIAPCKTKATFSVKPKSRCTMDFSKLKNVKISTPVAAVAEIDGEEIIIHKYGEIKFKKCKDKDKIKKIAEQVFSSCTSS